MEATQPCLTPQSKLTGDTFSVYVPQIGASIALKDEQTYRAAKIFWDDVAAQWEEKLKAKNQKPPEIPDEKDVIIRIAVGSLFIGVLFGMIYVIFVAYTYLG